MRARERHLVIAVATVWIGVLWCGEAAGQVSKLLDFGPDSMRLESITSQQLT